MENLRQYILSVTAAAMLCGAALSLSPEGTARELLRLLGGIALTVCLLRPLAGNALPLELPELDSWQGEQIAAEGEKEAQKALADIIKAKTEAYILDKAAALETDLVVEVTLDQGSPPLPQAAVIRGGVSPYARGRLESILSSELGITKEHQQWTG